jgi:hypothetical protein
MDASRRIELPLAKEEDPLRLVVVVVGPVVD